MAKLWQVLQLMRPLAESRGSKKSIRPRSIFSRVTALFSGCWVAYGRGFSPTDLALARSSSAAAPMQNAAALSATARVMRFVLMPTCPSLSIGYRITA